MTISEKQLAERVHYIGGSDVAGILGLSRWTTPLQVWAIKTGAIVTKDDGALSKRLGVRLEEVCAELFTEETGKELRRVNETIYHKDYPFLAANIDRRVVGENALFEAKTTAVWNRKEWIEENELPQEVIAQVQWYLGITGMQKAYVFCLVGNQEFFIKELKRDPVLIAEMTKRAVSFWRDFVVPKVMPGQVTAGDAETLYALFPQAEPESQVDLGDAATKIIEVRNAAYQDLLQIEKQIELHDNELKAMLKDKEAGLAGKYKVLWKNQKRKGFTVEPTEFRRFTIRELKGDPHVNG